jgi:hypothetical protein
MSIAQARIRQPGAGGSLDCYRDLLLDEPAETYHTRAKDYLSSHQLALFRECPLHYRKWTLGEITREDRPAYAIGRAAHTLILEGREAFDAQYAVGGPINPKTGAPFGPNTKAFAQWSERIGKSVLSQDHAQLVESMADSVRSHDLAGELLCSGTAEGVIRREYCNVPGQIRIDWFSPEYGIVDLKTTDNLKWFEPDARRFGYVYQLAFYRAIAQKAFEIELPVHLIAVEKREPFRCGVWVVPGQALDIAEQENEAAIERLRNCMATDHWPTGYEDLRIFDAV